MRLFALHRAQKSIETYMDEVNADEETDIIVDLFADLIQWCAFREVDFDATLEIARKHAEAEMRDEE